MGWLVDAVIQGVLKWIGGFIERQLELSRARQSGRDEQALAAKKSQQEGDKILDAAAEEAAQKHRDDPTDAAFDQEFRRKE